MAKCTRHNVKLEPLETRFGIKYICPISGCDIACWGHDRKIPTDQATRTARKACHSLFDPIWKSGAKSRGKMYIDLAADMGLTPKEAHFGRFSFQQCQDALKIILRKYYGQNV